MGNIVLAIFMRYLHIVSAVVAVGGMAFVLLCLTPAVRLLDDTLRASVMKLVHHRFLRVIWAAIAGLVVSGTYNWIMLADFYSKEKMGPKGNALIGTKVLLAVVLFAVVGARSLGLIQNHRRVLMINIHLAAIVILLGAILRYFRLEYLSQFMP